MKLSVLIIFCSSLIGCFAQHNEDCCSIIRNLKDVKELPYIPELSGDSLFWVIVKENLSVIPCLIDCLDDTTQTQAIVPNIGGNYTVADVAFQIITEIIKDIPTLKLIGNANNSEYQNGSWGYWIFTRESINNRIKFKERIREWYSANKDNLEWVEYKSKFRSAPNWKFEIDKHPLGGYYQLKGKNH